MTSSAAAAAPPQRLVVAVVVVLLFAGAVGYGIYRVQRGSDDVVAPAGGSATGLTVGQASAPATIDIYLDFQCPVCKAYEEQTGSTIDELVTAGQAKVVYHPVAYLDRYSSTQYSTRSSQASACAADAGVFPAYLTLLYAAQPPENSSGLPDDQLIALGRQAGAGDAFAAVRPGRAVRRLDEVRHRRRFPGRGDRHSHRPGERRCGRPHTGQPPVGGRRRRLTGQRRPVTRPVRVSARAPVAGQRGLHVRPASACLPLAATRGPASGHQLVSPRQRRVRAPAAQDVRRGLPVADDPGGDARSP